MSLKTADLYDKYETALQVVEPIFRGYGGRPDFAGVIATVKVHEDNKLVRSTLEQKGTGKVLVIDGGGSLRTALVGGNLVRLALDNGWQGLLVYGCLRDAAEIATMPLGVYALGTNPAKPKKNGFGEVGVVVQFGGVVFRPGEYIYADEDGIVTSGRKLD